MKRLCALFLSLIMLLGAFPAFALTAMAAEETAAAETTAAEETEKDAEPKDDNVVLDYNCDSLDPNVIEIKANVYPNTYIMDSRKEEIAEGTLHLGANGKLNGAAQAKIPLNMKEPSFALDLTMKVNSLGAFNNSIFCGLVLEIYVPNNRLLFLSIQDMGDPDENGKNATAVMSKAQRGQKDAMTARITIPTDDEFHNWQIQFDGKNEVRILIDGQIQAKFTDITVDSGTDSGYILLKNVMTNVVSGINDVVIDHMKMTTGITMSNTAITGTRVNPDACAEKLTVTTTVNKIPENGEIGVTVIPASDPNKAVKKTYKPEETTSSVEFTDLPFTGLCTVEVQMTDTLPHSFKIYLYDTFTYVNDTKEIKNEGANKAYLFNAMDKAERAEDSPWKVKTYAAASGETGKVLSFSGTKSQHSFTVPVEVSGKFAVYVGYVTGTREFTVNDKNVFIAYKSTAADRIKEAFAIADDFDGGRVTITNNPSVAAQIAYVKFVSLTDEQYEIYLAEDDSQNLMTDNDGYSIFTDEKYGKPENLIYSVLTVPSQRYNLGKFNFAMFSTSILNYDSEVWWKYVYSRMEELGIPKEKAPEDFLSHIDTKGEVMDFGDKWRDADKMNYASIRAINEYGAPHVLLADYAAEHELGEVYASLRMSHYSGINSLYPFQSGTLYYLHPEWLIDAGTYQLSYMHEEYRNYLHDLLIEMATPENITGITMDFGRYPTIFGKELADVEKRTEILNDFVKSVRDDLPEGKVLVARVLNPTDEKALAWGLDYKHWVKEGWIDRLIISDQSHETFFKFDEYMDFFKDYPDVEFYLGINGTLTGHDTTKEEEEILKAGGTIEGKTLVTSESFMLRAYEAYMAGADGIFIFNGPSSDPDMGGIPPYYAYMNNKALMEKWYTFEYPQSLFSEAITFVSEKGTLAVDYDCTTVTKSLTKEIPSYYFADSETEIDAEIEEGTILMSGTGEKEGYCTLSFPVANDISAYTLEMDVKVDSLTVPEKNNIWRGFVIEIGFPNRPTVYLAFHALEKKSGGNNAKVMAMTTVRGDKNLVEKEFSLPMDGDFHKWEIVYNGEGEAKLLIDEKEILTVSKITNTSKVANGSVQIKNIMQDIKSGVNKVTFDQITMTVQSVIAPTVDDTTETGTEAGASVKADTPAKVTVEGKKDILKLPVTDADWDKAPTPTDEEMAAAYKTTAKKAEAKYNFDKETGTLVIDITYNFGFWIGDAVLTDADGKKVVFTTDRTFGAGGTLWNFKYTDDGHANGIKTLRLIVDGVKELPDGYTLFVTNHGSGKKYTAKLNIEF